MRTRVLVVAGEPGAAPRVARAHRDAGHEVIVIGSGSTAEGVAAAAVQEDVDRVEIAPGAGGEFADLVAVLRRLLAAYGAGDIEVAVASVPRPDLP